MTTTALARIFSYLGAVLALLAIGAWVNNRDGPAIFHYVRFDERMTVDAYNAIIAISVLLIIVASALGLYASRRPGGWLHRIPVVRFSDKFPFIGPPDTQSEDIGRSGLVAYQIATLILVLLIPAGALVHLNHWLLYDRGRVWNAAVESVDGAPVIDTIPFLGPSVAGRAVLSSPQQNNGKADFRLVDRMEDIMTARRYADESRPKPERPPSEPCQGHPDKCTGVTWCPLWSPLLLWMLTLVAWLCTAWALFMIFGVNRAHPAAHGDVS